MTPPAAVLFDCDGVIVDSEPPTLALLIADLATHGLHMTVEQVERDFVGGTVERIATLVKARGVALPESWVADFYAKMFAMLKTDAPLLPGILEVFDRLDAAQVPFAVGSNGSLAKMEITLGARGLMPRFKAVLSGLDMGKPKPAPDLYLAAAAACGANPAHCVVIEDSPTGAQAALAAGMRCYGIAAHGRETVPAQGLIALGVPLFHSMYDLPDLLGLPAAVTV